MVPSFPITFPALTTWLTLLNGGFKLPQKDHLRKFIRNNHKLTDRYKYWGTIFFSRHKYIYYIYYIYMFPVYFPCFWHGIDRWPFAPGDLCRCQTVHRADLQDCVSWRRCFASASHHLRIHWAWWWSWNVHRSNGLRTRPFLRSRLHCWDWSPSFLPRQLSSKLAIGS